MMVRVATVLLVVVVGAGCAPARSGSLGPAPTAAPAGRTASATPSAPAPSTSSASASPSPAATSEAPPGGATSAEPRGTTTVQLWFTRDGKVVPTARTRPATLSTSRLALTELVAGPTAVEAAAAVGTGLGAGTTFEIAGIAGGVETVRFPASFYAGGADAVRLRQAQVVYTLTQFPTVTKVGFSSGAGLLAAPVGRADYADLLPPIVVTGPLIGQPVTSPIVVTGTAEVFEATVNVRVLDAAGHPVGTAFTLASCGSGCRGDYRVGVSYRVAAAQPGTVEVFEVSPRDGSRVNLVAVPVTLG